MKLPKYVVRQVTQHGNVAFYFRRGKTSRVRLPAPDHPEFMDAYWAAFDSLPVPHVRDMPPSPVVLRKQRVEAALKGCFQSARSRAAKRGLAFELTLDWLLATAESQQFKCAITGIEFFYKTHTKCRVDPYMPSLDQIVPSGGYTKENTRIILRALNVMLFDWGTEIFEQVANSYRYSKSKRR